MITTVSLDLDGTLLSDKDDRHVWDEAIPQAYADHHGVSYEEARKQVFTEYYTAQHIDNVDNWDDLPYWVNRLNLATSASQRNDVIARINDPYDDVDVIPRLREAYTVTVFTNSTRPLMEAKLDTFPYEFDRAISAPTDYNANKRDKAAWTTYLDDLDVSTNEIVHVGDRPLDDVKVPGSVGIQAYLVDRDGETGMSSLRDLLQQVNI